MAPPGYITCQPLNTTSQTPADIGKDDLNALLYIVVTLLFYSMGIIIGIITYLKREQVEMEEDKMFDLYLSLKREPFNVYKRERVNQMAIYLKQMEEARLAREKIEIWKAEQQIHNSKARQSFCADPSQSDQNRPAASQSHRLGFGKDGMPLGVPESDFAENGGASALLCSLTLGVCEPLLTPEGARSRLTFPGHAVLVSPSDSNRMSPRILSQRHSVPSLNSVKSLKPTDTDDSPLPDDVFSAHASDIHLAKKASQYENSDSNIELQDLRLFHFNFTKAMLQNKESFDDSKTSFANPSPPAESVPSSRSTNKNAPRKLSYLQRQMSLDAERKYCSPDCCEAESTPFVAPVKPVIEEEMSSSSPSISNGPQCSFDQPCSSTNMDYLKYEPVSCVESELPHEEPSLPIAAKHLPHQLEGNEPNPQLPTADVRPKLHGALSSGLPTLGGRSKGLVPAEKKRLRAQGLGSWRHTVDIPDGSPLQSPNVASGRRKNNDKRLTQRQPSRDNERRGALLFTQKSLHHIENDSPKISGAKRGLLGHQDSADSYSSRNTEVSELTDSPLLQHTFEGPVTSNTEPSPLSKQPRRMAKLARSQTVDPSRSYNL